MVFRPEQEARMSARGPHQEVEVPPDPSGRQPEAWRHRRAIDGCSATRARGMLLRSDEVRQHSGGSTRSAERVTDAVAWLGVSHHSQNVTDSDFV